ncbi:helix-turn-helix domain-containing protein [Flaviflagellibacter deserti]|uniref:Helix-turn-helix domain-containing protein n=1 Tax=Flaviflagellibacter deserti TaxID=2267266 RepID=A0ABV9Z2U8_9HYPH
MHKPLAYHIDEAAKVSGIGRSKIYEAVGEGALKAVKCGRRTLIKTEDLEAFIASLPALVTGRAA